MLNRRTFLAALPLAAAQQRRPNTLFILIDDLRYDALGCLGHPWLKTPNIDRIAKEGAIFRNAFVTTSLCSPSRASFMTGRWVQAHGIKSNGDNAAMSHQLVTFSALQQKAGYETAYIGKLHMGEDASPRPGFDHWVSFKGQGVYTDPEFNINGKAAPQEGFMTDLLNEQAIKYLKQPRTKPFSLYFAHKAVHGPFTPPERHRELYADAPIQKHPNAQDDLTGKPMLQREILVDAKKNPGQVRGGPPNETIRNQLRLMQAVDEGVGEIFKVLEETKQLDNTLIIFTSDNGYFHGDHGLGDKRAAYEESLRIPFVARYPKWFKAGSTNDAVILNVDIAPTMMEIAGVKPPANVRGKSLVPLFAGGVKAVHADFYCEYFEEPGFPRIPTWHAVRTDRWKYIEYPGNAEWSELYDLKNDPYELKNLVAEPTAAIEKKKLQTRLVRLKRETL
jgi:N-acetylglucosamine-6-sulfatase